MKRRLTLIAAMVAALTFLPASAEATCQPGRIALEGRKLVVEWPQCDPYP